MDSHELLIDGFGRIQGLVHRIVDGVSAEHLHARLDDEASTIGWLVWHLTRVQDDHIADVAAAEQVWTAAGWADRFGLPFEASATGYGQGPADVAALRIPSPELLTGYYDAVHVRTTSYLQTLNDVDLDRVVDDNWDPPVTLGVRLVSVISDDLQHAGQAAYVRGVLERQSRASGAAAG